MSNHSVIEHPLDDKYERTMLSQHLRRAERVGLPATLCMDQWLTTLAHFDYHCAYCLEGMYEVLEHFIPLSLKERGTTFDNCIPACRKCNAAKREFHPLHLPFAEFPSARGLRRVGQGIARVQHYLETCGSEVEE